MNARVFLKQQNEDKYDELDLKEFSVLPRENEFLSVELKGVKKFFQVIAVHHAMQSEVTLEVYAVEADPSWEIKKKRGIGFGA